MLGIKIPNKNGSDIRQANYPEKIESLKRRLSLWSYRYLTPYGKIHLVKTEALSQLVYSMTVLPKPSPLHIKQIETAVFQFIWGNKNDKVKRATLKSKYKEGGLQVPDVSTQADSLKITWAKKYMNKEIKHNWKTIMKSQLSLSENLSIFDCNPSLEIITKAVKSQFWREILQAWARMENAQETPRTGEEALRQTLWMNKHINLETIGIFDRRVLIQRGLTQVRNLYNLQRRCMLTTNEIAAKYDLHPLSASALLRAIPDNWKRFISANRPARLTTEVSRTAELHKVPGVARWAYRKLLTVSCQPIKSQQKWKHELKLPANFSWSNIYQGLYETTDDIPLRWLQLRILHRILPTNKHLQIFGISQTDKCQHCLSVPESLIHIFWTCPVTQRFWRDLSQMCNSTDFTDVRVMLNSFTETAACMPRQSIQLLTLISKQHIWRCRARSVKPTIHRLIDALRAASKVDKYVSKIKGSSTKFEKLWNPIINILPQT